MSSSHSDHALIIGTFDGVHRGHQALIDEARRAAGSGHDEARRAAGSGHDEARRAAGSGRLSVMTFHPHPRAVVGTGSPRMLLSLERRKSLLMEAGADDVVVVDFTPDLARMSPDEFMSTCIHPLAPTVVLVGENFRFGKGAAGSYEDLARFGDEHGGWRASPLGLVCGDDGGTDGVAAISASRIRALVRVGNVRAASLLLGRPHELEGPVVHGEKRGRELGMPTANLGLDPGRAIPDQGVYAGWAYVRGERHATAISVGTNPHFTQDHAAPPLTVEAHLLDFDADIYDEQIRIEFIERTRGQATFASLDELIQTMQQDVRNVRQLLAR